jgi:hypothetical protein
VTTSGASMAIQFDSDSSVAADGFAASVDCPAGTGRRRQQVNYTADAVPAGGATSEVPAGTAGTSEANTTGRAPRGRDLIAESNVDSFKFDSDTCVAKPDKELYAADCKAIADEFADGEGPGILDQAASGFKTEDELMIEACTANSNCVPISGQQAFVFLIPLDFDERTIELNISSLVDYLWVDQKTQDVEVRFATYNGNSKLFSIVHMTMEFDLSGQTSQAMTVDTVNLELWGSQDDYIRVGLELFICAYTFFNLLGELKELFKDGHKKYFHDWWNYME